MLSRIITAVIGVLLMVGFLGAYVVKLRSEAALAVVLLIGIAMMLVDAWQSVKEED